MQTMLSNQGYHYPVCRYSRPKTPKSRTPEAPVVSRVFPAGHATSCPGPASYDQADEAATVSLPPPSRKISA